ncbi:MAG: hypothetical protein ABIF77_12650, partial [bacterium]
MQTILNGFVACLCLAWFFCLGWLLPASRQMTPESAEPGEQRETSGAMSSLEFWATQRAYPSKTFPSRGFVEAFDQAQRDLPEVMEKDRAVTPWQPLGPHNIGGRTLAVALNPLNPHTVYAGSASGGLWRSYTGGRGALAWQYVSTGYPVLAVSSIAISPKDSNTIFIGTGEVYAYQDTQGGIADRLTRGSYGIGILQTTDGGLTWTKSLDWSAHQERGVQVVKMCPRKSGIIWAGTTEGTYKTIDNGKNWDPVHSTIMVTDLVINPDHPNTVIIACGNLHSVGQGLYRTTDGGVSWTQLLSTAIPTNLRGKTLLSICDSQPGTILASSGNGGLGSEWTWLSRTDNGGDTWTLMSTTDYSQWQGWFSHDVAVNPDNPDEVFTVGIDIWKSTTGGGALQRMSDWQQWYFGQVQPGEPEGAPDYSHADHHDLVYHPTDRNIIYFANDGGIFRTLDGGS